MLAEFFADGIDGGIEFFQPRKVRTFKQILLAVAAVAELRDLHAELPQRLVPVPHLPQNRARIVENFLRDVGR